jgi:hypothetical protein
VPVRGPAVRTTLPTARAVMLNWPVRLPAGIVVEVGTLSRSGSSTVRGTAVSVSCVAVRVRVHTTLAPRVRGEGHARAWSRGRGGWTSRVAVAWLPGRLAVTVAVPRLRPRTGRRAVRLWAGTRSSDPGRPTTLGLLVVRATAVSVGWLAFSVRVSVPVLPSVRARTGGRRLTTAGAGTTTVTELSALLPGRLAVTVAVPGARPRTAKGWLPWPAGTVTRLPGGRPTTAGSLVPRLIRVSTGWAALSVTVRVPAAPWVTWRVAGVRLVRVGPAGAPVTVLSRLLPLRSARRVALPGARPVTGIWTVSCPAGTVAVAGTVAIQGARLSREMTVASGCPALRVAVSVPVLPWVTARLGGSRLLRVGGGMVAETVRTRKAPGLLVRRTWRVLFAWRETARSRPATPSPKSEGLATSTAFTQIFALLIRCVPLAFPFCTCRR